jgi:twitching motility protein PilT
MDINALMQESKSQGASDLHLVLGTPPMLRIKGALQPLESYGLLSAEEINQAFLQVATPEEREHFHTHLELDFAYTQPGVGRIRCNAAQQRGAVSLALRLLPLKIPTLMRWSYPRSSRSSP